MKTAVWNPEKDTKATGEREEQPLEKVSLTCRNLLASAIFLQTRQNSANCCRFDCLPDSRKSVFGVAWASLREATNCTMFLRI